MDRRKIKLIISILKLAILLLVIVGIPVYIFTQYPDLLSKLKDVEAVDAYLERYKAKSILVYLGLQTLQVLVSVIPGQILQLAGGYVFNFGAGLLLSFIGLSLGTILTFFFARALGKDAMHVLMSEDRLNYFVEKLNSKRAYNIIFVIFLIPGIPKDLCCYAAGISEVKLKPFLIISIVGRTPGIIGSIAIGDCLYSGSYAGVIALGILGIILFILGIKYREKLIKKTDEIYNKWMSK